ncbi:glutaredoxin family protein [Undibacterium umbellatum]|uniref:Glutaredoxin family protein n=1 Tax=Undibacterium umbellatum TaxID=2762300 RepID=A0ABR6ZG39_9BURK|nr:glutaredoxin family protein [Undibacterium umbellatum]MBC3910315.1 glutaredoxin family protein [Undibacterium umbellatum]
MKQQIKKWGINIFLITATAALALAIGSQVPALMKNMRGPYKNGDFSEHLANLPHKLTLYGTTSCPHCENARLYLKRAGIPFNDQIIDRSSIASTAYKQLGEVHVPVLVSKQKLIVGFDEKYYANLSQQVYAK